MQRRNLPVRIGRRQPLQPRKQRTLVHLPLLFKTFPGEQRKDSQRAANLCLQSPVLRGREVSYKKALTATGEDGNLQGKPLGTFPSHRTGKRGRGDQSDRHGHTAHQPVVRPQSRTFRTTGNAGLRDHCDIDPAYIRACLSPRSS